ncbi:MAG: molybdopterin-binding protein [Eubacteriales bacterium]|nr:molybdopterin-binding protein [Eubacteriales bacterium]
MGIIRGICVSEKRGTQKHPVEDILLRKDFGLEGDAHGGNWHRQVSLLGIEKIEEFQKRGAEVHPGSFGENIIVEGLDLASLPVGTQFRAGEALLELTQIGKDCHSHCTIYHSVGDCIMPREGVFARVLKSGRIHVGDEICISKRETPFPWQAAVITLSDKGAAGEREDKSGPYIANRLKEEGYCVVEQILLPDDQTQLEKALIRLCDQRQPDLILTTGGTGFGPRDTTPEATLSVAHRLVPGIAEAIRAESLKITPHAMLGRGVSVIRGKTLIINLPGSPKACRESMDVFMGVIPHGMGLLRDEVRDCGEPFIRNV